VAEKLKIKDIINIIKSPKLIALAIANLLMVGSLEGLSDVWGVNYLVAGYGMEKSSAAQIISFIAIGMIFGGPILAFFSQYIGEYIMIFIAGLVMALCIILLLYSPMPLNDFMLSSICFVIGIMCCYQLLVFSIGSKISSKQTLSLTIAFLNCINMLGGAFFHTLIGIGMDSFSQNTALSGIYSVDSYQIALLIIPICAIVGGVIALLLWRKQN
jgi:MFS family permease